MAWYDPFRHVVEPWIQFIRNIPPLAYVFLIIAALGVGQVSKVTVIFIAAFLVMVITIYQGVKGVDTTLIKAARVLGAKQKDIFFKITIPASTPFILVAARLGLSTSMTTLMASEIVGGDKGIGMMISTTSSRSLTAATVRWWPSTAWIWIFMKMSLSVLSALPAAVSPPCSILSADWRPLPRARFW